MLRARVVLFAALLVLGRVGVARGQSVEPSRPAARVTLQEAVQRALQRNPSAEVAALEIRRAEALVREARSASLPSLVGSATYTRLNDDRRFNGNVISAANQLAVNLTLTVPLVVPQKWVQWRTAGDAVQVNRAASEQVRRDLAVAVGRAYLTVVAQRRVVEVNERALVTAKAHYDFAHVRLTGGIGNRIDEVRAGQEMAADEAQVEVAYTALARAEEALGVLLGAEGPIETAADVDLAPPPALATALDESRARRDVRAFETRSYAADRAVRGNWADYAPFLEGVVQPFYQTPATLTLPTTGWQAQLILTLPLYDGGLRYGQHDERDALAAEARIQVEGALRQARSEVRTGFEALRRADAGLASATTAAKLAGEALKLANIAYQAGATTNLEVIDAERRARDADTSAVVAEDGARQARLDLLAASGRFP